MKTEKLPEVPAKESGDFYYHHFKLPYGNQDQAPREKLQFDPDPTVSELMDVSTGEGDQLGFVILRDDNTVEVVDTVTGEHVRVRFGEKNTRRLKK